MQLNDGSRILEFRFAAGSWNWPIKGQLQFTDDSNDGHIARMIILKSTFDVDRPWISMIDENSRHVAAHGYHTKLTQALGGDVLKQFEVKTIASSGGSNPADMRTRFAIQCDVERGTWGVNYIDNFEINQAENPIITSPGSITPAGLRIRLAPQDTFSGSATNVCASFLVQVDAADNTVGFLDVMPPYTSGGSLFPGAKTTSLNIFRNTNASTASSPQFNIKKGDGTNTTQLQFLAVTGALTIVGPLGINGAAAPAKPTVSGAKGSNAALASLLTALVSYGFVTDSTTA